MYIRYMSSIIHGGSKFYARNLGPLPIYNKIFPDERPGFRPEGFDGETCTMDLDLPMYHANWVEFNANALGHAYELDNLVSMNGGAANISPIEWMKMDPFLREALKLAYNRYAKAENQKQSRMQSDMDQKIESAKEYKSPFSGITKPTFIN